MVRGISFLQYPGPWLLPLYINYSLCLESRIFLGAALWTGLVRPAPGQMLGLSMLTNFVAMASSLGA